MIDVASLGKGELADFIRGQRAQLDSNLLEAANRVRRAHFGNRVYLRGLVEISSVCRNDCLYCGLRKSNGNAVRYRLDEEQIRQCCQEGDRLGFRTFVLQGGEDSAFTDDVLCRLIHSIKDRHPHCAVTLSLGERSRDSYRVLYRAGADRYLLRHESADPDHYSRLHPPGMTLDTRKRCLWNLMEIGFQTGAGLMVGSPGQTPEHLAEDLLFLKELQPHMVGIGPFLPHRDTPFRGEPPGSLEETLLMLALTRLLLPMSLLPATTALGSLVEGGREMGLRCGANVVMPNLSPGEVRPAYALYDNKLYSGSEAAEGLSLLRASLEAAGFVPDMSRGDHEAVRVRDGVPEI